MFTADDPPTPIETILQWLFQVIVAQGGGLDVFYYVQAHPEVNNSGWNGLPNSYQPSVSDSHVCNLFLNHSLFTNTSGNRFFCLVEPEMRLLTPWMDANQAWSTYNYAHLGLHAREQFVQQLYGMYRANVGAKQYALANSITYTYKLRVRPDVALIKPFSTYDQFNFGDGVNATKNTLSFSTGSTTTICTKRIFCPHAGLMVNGAMDSFNIGLAEDMDHLLDRYVDFTTLPFPELLPTSKSNANATTTAVKKWMAEDYLVALMRTRYNICIVSAPDILMVTIRSKSRNHQYTPMMQYWQPPKSHLGNNWKQIIQFKEQDEERLKSMVGPIPGPSSSHSIELIVQGNVTRNGIS